MPSPFPGMDPYIESSGYWAGFHRNLSNRIKTVLNQSMAEGYFAEIDEYLNISGFRMNHSMKAYCKVNPMR